VHIRLLLFASYAEAFGKAEIPLELPDGATAGDALASIRSRPGAERLPPKPLIAINQRYAKPDAPLHDGDELALIPPVAGG
jgi:molybdopterin converting factor subunit 1